MWGASLAAILLSFVTASIVSLVIVARRKRLKNAKSSLGLTLVLLSWIIGALVGILFEQQHSISADLQRTAGLFVAGVFLMLGLFLAALGYGNARHQTGKFKSGVKRAVGAFCIAGLVLVLSGVGVVRTIVSKYSTDQAIVSVTSSKPAAASTRPSEPIQFVDENFTFVPPPIPWLRADAKKIVPDSCLAYLSPSPDLGFAVVETNVGVESPISLDQAAELVKVNVQAKAAGVQWGQPSSKTIADVPGVLLENNATVAGINFTYVHWVGLHQGRLYHLALWGRREDANIVRQEADSIMSGFSLLDPNKPPPKAAADLETIARYSSDRNHYTLNFGPGWKRWNDAMGTEAEFGAQHGNDTRLLVGVASPGESLDGFDLLLHCTCQTLGIPFEQSNTKLIQLGTANGAIINRTSAETGKEVHHVRMIVHYGKGLFMLHAWTTNPQKLGVIGDVLTSLTLHNDFVHGSSAMSPAEISLTELILNDMGVRALDDLHQPEHGVEYFKRASALKPDSIQVIDNLAEAYLQADQPRLARLLVHDALQKFPADPRLHLRAATVEAALGDSASAAAQYESLFRQGYRDDVSFETYINMLDEQQRLDDAIAAIERYRQHFNSREIGLLHARMLAKKGSHDRAIVVLEDMRQGFEFDPIINYMLSNEYSDSGRYNSALVLAEDLIKRGIARAEVYVAHASALTGLKRYRDAKTSLEIALKKSPTNRDAQELMRIVEALLGEGDHTLIKNAIQQVPIPDALLANIPATQPTDAEDSGGYCIARIDAVQFDPGKVWRKTELRKYKIVNRDGVEVLNNYALKFDPLNESIYVNRVEVTDASGKVSVGKPEDCYVLDTDGAERASLEKQVHIPIPGLAEGCTVLIIATREENSPPKQMRFDRHFFSSGMPVQRSAFVLRADPKNVRTVAFNGVKSSQIDGATCWQAENLLPIIREPLQTVPAKYLPSLVLGDPTSSWKEEGDDYLDMVKDYLQEDPTCKTLAQQLTQGITDHTARVAALVRYVQMQYVYRAIEFGRRARIPQKPEQTIANKYGDCKDHAFLLYQLLLCAGYQPKLALVNAEDDIAAEVPALDQFNHIIACMKASDGSWLWFDCTGKDIRATDSPPVYLAGKQVLVLSAGASQLVRVPDLASDSNTLDSSRQITIQAQGDLQIHETVRANGTLGAYLREILKSAKTENRTRIMQEVISSTGVEAAIRKVSVDQLLDPYQQLVINIDYTIPSRFMRVQNQLVGTVPACWERLWLLPTQGGTRIAPFEIREPTRIQSDTTLIWPSGMTLLAKPTDQQNAGRFGDARASYTIAPDRINLKTTLRGGHGEFPVESYSEFQQSRQTLVRQLEPALSFVSK